MDIKDITKDDIKACLYERASDSHKGTYGYIALIGGNVKYSGAIRLANMANCAMRAGSGVVKLAAPSSLKEVILPNILESTFYPLADDGKGNYTYDKDEINELISGVSVVAVGMGIGNSQETKKLIKHLMTGYDGILLIDADGLNALSSLIHDDFSGSADYQLLDNAKARIILTPHPKEFSRLSAIDMKDILSDPAKVSWDFSRKHKVITLIKGNITYITDGNIIYRSDKGCPGMATAGSGDVLSGVISALCGYNRERLLAATAVASYVTGLAGELAEKEYGSISMVASDTAKHIAMAVRYLTQN